MKKRQIFAFIAGIVISFVLLVILQSFTQPPLLAANSKLLVSAAASVQDALKEVTSLYETNNPNVNITYNFGSSGALQRQIENGAPVDLFISAAKKQMDALAAKDLILTDTRRDLLTNRLVLIVPSNSQLNLTNFSQLTDNKVKRIAIGEPKSVPAGQYADEVFQKLGILQQIQTKFVLGSSVRQVLSYVETGNADAGVVYISDAQTSKQVKQVSIAEESLHSPIIYPTAVLKSSKNIAAAQNYLKFLSSEQAANLFKKYGFGIPKNPPPT